MPLWDHLVVESQREYVCSCMYKLLVVRHLEHGIAIYDTLNFFQKFARGSFLFMPSSSPR